MLFDLLTELQGARLHEQRSAKQDLIRRSIRRLRETAITRQTTSAGNPVTSDVSRDLLCHSSLTCDGNEPS
jgi:GoLoco motif